VRRSSVLSFLIFEVGADDEAERFCDPSARVLNDVNEARPSKLLSYLVSGTVGEA
jgi:hypothetical protein